ncbi:MAG: gamma-glutamyltranspeptidase [Burkholderiaceae bacterium]|jgi:gamma-glutamyltranspeptidase/glutathione hydrolase|nr:gamma-glutamyltranspeptidase [Burkholderiaceae bacterium]
MNRVRALCIPLLPLAAALLFTAPAFADETLETPGVPAKEMPAQARGTPPPWAGKAARQGVVAVSHPLAAEAGARALERGGNAIDAAAAIQFVLNVVEPQFSGIGGGGFMMIHLASSGETFAVDSRERAPAAATPDMFAPGGTPLTFLAASTSGLSVGVPGTLLGVDTALRRWGTQTLAEALAPAIQIAEQGFRINRFLAANIASDGGRTSFQPETAAIFRPGGVPLAEGDLLVQPDLAKTFKLIASQGTDVFYKGEIAQAIVEAQKRTRTSPVPADGVGRMALSDLAAYAIALRQPITVDYRGWQVASMSPPSSGGLTVGQMLEILERYPVGSIAQGFGFGATKTMHVMIESMRLAFADRAVWMGDEDFVPVPKKGLLDPAYVASRAALINLNSRMTTPAAGNPLPFNVARGVATPRVQLAVIPFEDEKGVHTTHFSVVDKHGNVVSYTTTIENTWGTGITVPGYGFLLNNELTDFNFVPALNPATGNPGANDVAPFKRPRSSMSPSIVFKNGQPFAAYGSPGGSTIINSVLNVTLNLIDHGMTIQGAIDAPRLSVTSALGTVSCETGLPFMQPAFSDATLAALKALGHFSNAATGALACSTTTIGSVQGVIIDLQTGKQYGGADQRREGTVITLPRPRGK